MRQSEILNTGKKCVLVKSSDEVKTKPAGECVESGWCLCAFQNFGLIYEKLVNDCGKWRSRLTSSLPFFLGF